MSYIEKWDIIVICVYFLCIMGASFYSMVGRKRNTVDSYFLAGRGMNWVLVGLSLFASNIGSEHFIGLAGSGAATGLAVGAFELNAMIIIQILGWVFLPVFIASGVATLPEYMNKRFGGTRIRIYLSCLSLVLYIFTKISVNLYSGSLFIKIALGWDLYYSVLLILAMTALCTITGGLAAVIYTETIQSIIMVGGGLTLMGFAFKEIGGYENLYIKYMESIPNEVFNMTSNLSSKYIQCAKPRDDAFQILRSINDRDMPWLGFLIGQTPSSIWYWCSDQMMVQRTLAAKSLSHAQGGTLLAGYIKILPLFMMVIPGMISRALYKDSIACADPDVCFKLCGSRNGCSNAAYPMLVMNLMPTGLKGLMLAVMLAALMADLTSVFNSSSTLFTVDIFQQIYKKPSNSVLMIVGRLFALLMVGIGILWIPIIKNMQGAQLYIYIQSVTAYIAPPIAAVYLVAILWIKANEKGAFWALMIGMLTGVIRMVLNFIYVEPECGEPDTRPSIIKNLHYLYFAMILFILTGVVMIVISLVTNNLDYFRTIRTTFWTRKSLERRPDEEDFNEIKEEIQKGSDNIAAAVDDEFKITFHIDDNEKNKEQFEMQIETPQPAKAKKSKRKKFLDLVLNIFCGIETKKTSETEQKRDEAKRRLESIDSLNQTKFEKYILNSNLIFIIVIYIFLMTFFSIPPRLHLFKHVHFNRTEFFHNHNLN